MPAFEIPSFKFGMDQRRARVAGAISTLWDLQNAHITRGGDVQRSKAFVPQYVLPNGCFGLVAIASRLFTFGSAALTMPPGMSYQQLVAENGAVMIGVLAAGAFLGNTYVIAEYADGNVRHFYNGARVANWDTISDANSSFQSLADYLANKCNGDANVEATSYANTILLTSRVPGVATAISATATNNGAVNDQTAGVSVLQAAVPAQAEIVATAVFYVLGGTAQPGVNTFLQISAGAANLLISPVDWSISNNATATALATQINNGTAASGFVASASANAVTVSGVPGSGAGPNGRTINISAAGNAFAGNPYTVGGMTFSGGAAPVVPVGQIVSVTLGGTFEPLDLYSLIIGANTYKSTGRASGAGLSIYVFGNRIYSCANTHLKYCALNNPADWTNMAPSSGAGFINIASQTAGSERLIGVEGYGPYAAIFSSRSVRLYLLTTDATQVSYFQTLKNNGSIAPLSFQPFQATDVFYLDVSGVRSLRERDTTYTAYAADVGSAIDTPLQAWLANVGAAVAFNAVSVIEPLDGRYMVAIGSRIWVYSYFPATQIGAWSHYDPGINIAAFAIIKNRLFCLAGNTVYLYGGTTGQSYPAAGVAEPSFVTPFHSQGDPEAFKTSTQIEIGATGVWQISLLVNPDNLNAVVNGGTTVNNTYVGPAANVVGRQQLFALQMTCESAGYADFSSFLIDSTQKASR